MIEPPDHEEVLKRIERELIDGYDEELELEVEDRTAEEVLAGGAREIDHARQARAPRATSRSSSACRASW